MGNILYVLAILFLIVWAIGLRNNLGGMIHVLLVVAIIAVIVRLFQRKKLPEQF